MAPDKRGEIDGNKKLMLSLDDENICIYNIPRMYKAIRNIYNIIICMNIALTVEERAGGGGGGGLLKKVCEGGCMLISSITI